MEGNVVNGKRPKFPWWAILWLAPSAVARVLAYLKSLKIPQWALWFVLSAVATMLFSLLYSEGSLSDVLVTGIGSGLVISAVKWLIDWWRDSPMAEPPKDDHDE